MLEILVILTQIIFINIILTADNAIIIGSIAANFVPKNRKQIILWGIGGALIFKIIFASFANEANIILKINAPPIPHKIICFLFFGTKLAAIDPMMIALSAVKIILINIICVNITSISNKVLY